MRSRTGISSNLKRKKKTIRRQARRAERRRVFVMESLEERRVLSVAPWAAPDDLHQTDLAAAYAGPHQVEGDHIVTASGATIFLDPPAPAAPQQAGTGTGAGGINPVPFPLADTFTLHSHPSATKRIYLDFDGFTTTDTQWNGDFVAGADIVSPSYDFDGDPLGFSDSELGRIQQIWEQVSEDFAPFDIDVTTEEPPLELLTNSGGGDNQWGVRVVIAQGDWFTQNPAGGVAGGVAVLGSFSDAGDVPCFVFPEFLGSGEQKATAEAISHEVGHTLGLSHDGDALNNYYAGQGTGPTSWAPIMGTGYYSEVVQWSKGEYTGANNLEDDLAIITANNGFGYRPDDAGDAPADAAPLARDEGRVFQTGLIETTDDVDVFSLTTLDGDIDLYFAPFHRSPDLDIQATLYDADGNVVLTSNPLGALDAALRVTVDPGTYYVAVEGVGEGDPAITGYSDYGSLGQYQITGTLSSLSSISGTRWADSSNDGVRDAGEAGVANVMIYIDLNLNGRIDLDEPMTRTDQDGHYRFQVVPGQYTVRQALTPGWVQTAPANPAGGSSEGFGHVVVVDSGEEVKDVDFGNFHLADDYGTAPAPYPTSSGSAQNLAGFHLGADGYLDDGVRFLTGLHPGRTEQIVVQASYNNYPSAYLQGWIDFNGDGDWSDPGEQIVKNFTLVEGSNVVSFQVPAGVNVNPNAAQWARFRFGYEYDFGPTGLAMAGEVEDYPVQFPQAADTGMIARDDTYNLDEDSPVATLDVLANDELGAGGGALRITSLDAASVNGLLQIDPNSNGTRLLYQPPADFFGTETFSYTVVDGLGGSKTAEVTINVADVNDPPVAVDDSFFDLVDYYAPGDEPVTTVLNVLANDTTGDQGETLRITAVGTPEHGTVTIQNGTILVYTPDPGYLGDDNFTYTISDGRGGTDTANVELNVSQLEDLVRLRTQVTDLDGNPISSAYVGEEFVLQVWTEDLRAMPEGVLAAYLDVFYDQDLADALSDTLAGGDAYGGTSGTQGGSLIADFTTDGVIDEAGAIANDLLNDPPLGGGEYLLFSVHFTAEDVGQLTFDGDPADTIATALFGTPNTVGRSRIEFDSATLQIDAVPVFEAVDDGPYFAEPGVETELTPGVRANDTTTAAVGQVTITVQAGSSNFNHGGSARVEGDTIYYTSVPGFEGTETFSYTITDEGGHSATATVTMFVAVPNDPPVVVNDNFPIPFIEDSTDNVLNVLANDSTDPGETLSIASVQSPTNVPGQTEHGGSVTIDNGRVLYTPAPDYYGPDSFTYTVSDGTPGNNRTATVTLAVENVNDPPDAVDDTPPAILVGESNVPIDVLANDTYLPDPLETLTLDSVQSTVGVAGRTDQGGFVTIVNGQVSYTPPTPIFAGADSFTYTISDENGGTDTATVFIDVTEPDVMEIDLKFFNALGEEVSQVPIGSTVTVNVYVEDLRPGGEGVAAAYLDLAYNTNFVQLVTGSLQHADEEHGGDYGELEEAAFIQGEIKGAGSMAQRLFNPSKPPLEPGPHLLFSVEFTAQAAGEATFTPNIIDDASAIGSDYLMFNQGAGNLTPDDISFVADTLTVTGPAPLNNAANPLDVNADGRVTARDVLFVVDTLLQRGGVTSVEEILGQQSAPPSDTISNAAPLNPDDVQDVQYVDVNADGKISARDILFIVTELRRDWEQRHADDAAPAAAAPFDADVEVAEDASQAVVVAEAAPRRQIAVGQAWGVPAAADTTGDADATASSDDAVVETGGESETEARTEMETATAPTHWDVDAVFADADDERSSRADDEELDGILTEIAGDVAVAWRD